MKSKTVASTVFPIDDREDLYVSGVFGIGGESEGERVHGDVLDEGAKLAERAGQLMVIERWGIHGPFWI